MIDFVSNCVLNQN